MQHIADHLNVSKFVVSKALSGKAGVSDETRERVIKAATQLGYTYPNKSRTSSKRTASNRSSSTADKHSKTTVLVMIPNHPYHQKYEHYWGSLLKGITEGLEDHQLGAMVVTNHNIDYFWQIINPQKLLGIIGVGRISNQLLLELKNYDVPFVLIEHEDPIVPSDTLFTDNIEGAGRLTSYLIGLGHERFQFVGKPAASQSYHGRWLGFRSRLEESNIPLEQNEELLNIQYANGEMLTEDLVKTLAKMIDDHSLPTAFVCANDAIAMSVIEALRKLGKEVPRDCSVTGFDNINETESFQPGLTTVNVAKELMGRRAVEKLLWRLSHIDYPYEKLLMYGKLVIRQSAQSMNK